jgi:3-dehydrotetronate 4-kinase
MLLGCIADDLTGATDLAVMLARNGMRTIQSTGVPQSPLPEVDALVIALKSRTIPAAEAVAQSLAALDWLRQAGARQILFKYCSTFDSTPAGNIGPVADALLDALKADFTVACPAMPANGRTIYQGHLFVGSVLLSDSGMRNHPLTPMTDSNLVSVLGRQTRHKVGLVPSAEIDAGPEAVKKAFAALKAQGMRYAITDALSDAHLRTLGTAMADFALITGGSGIAMGLPENFRKAGHLKTSGGVDKLPPAAGHAAIIAGSCSTATLGQVEAFRASHPAFEIDPLALAKGRQPIDKALAWAGPKLGQEPILIYASAPPERVAAIQQQLGREEAGGLIEKALAEIAVRLVENGVRRLVVAGGETSGAVVNALGVQALQIGPEIDPGVPWTLGLDQRRLFLALKSGNFGSRDFFRKAFEVLP